MDTVKSEISYHQAIIKPSSVNTIASQQLYANKYKPGNAQRSCALLTGLTLLTDHNGYSRTTEDLITVRSSYPKCSPGKTIQ